MDKSKLTLGQIALLATMVVGCSKAPEKGTSGDGALATSAVTPPVATPTQGIKSAPVANAQVKSRTATAPKSPSSAGPATGKAADGRDGTPPPGDPPGPPPDGDWPGPPPDGDPPGPPPDGQFVTGGNSGGNGGNGQGFPGGPPPEGMPPGGPPPGFGQRSNYKLTGKLTVSDGSTQKKASLTLSTATKDESVVYATGNSHLTLEKPNLSSSGNTSSFDNSSFHGLNAVVLAGPGSRIDLSGGEVKSTGTGANGLFAAGPAASVTMTGGKIDCRAAGAHGVMATKSGSVHLKNVDIYTADERGAPIATDRGSGTIIVEGGSVVSDGRGSPSLYSTGDIRVTGTKMVSRGAEGAVIEGANSITIKDATLTARKLWGAMIYQSFSGDAEGQKGVFRMTGGRFDIAAGPAFYVNNTNAFIYLSGVKIDAKSGVLLNAAAGRWGTPGQNGGHANLIATAQTLKGDITVGGGSSANLSLTQASSLSGRINGASLQIDASSKWIVTADSTVKSLTGGIVLGDTISNITGNGKTVTYDPSAPGNGALGGKTYRLAGGGILKPAK